MKYYAYLILFLTLVITGCSKPNAPTSENFIKAIKTYMKNEPNKFIIFSSNEVPGMVLVDSSQTRLLCPHGGGFSRDLSYQGCSISYVFFKILQSKSFYVQNGYVKTGMKWEKNKDFQNELAQYSANLSKYKEGLQAARSKYREELQDYRKKMIEYRAKQAHDDKIYAEGMSSYSKAYRQKLDWCIKNNYNYYHSLPVDSSFSNPVMYKCEGFINTGNSADLLSVSKPTKNIEPLPQKPTQQIISMPIKPSDTMIQVPQQFPVFLFDSNKGKCTNTFNSITHSCLYPIGHWTFDKVISATNPSSAMGVTISIVKFSAKPSIETDFMKEYNSSTDQKTFSIDLVQTTTGWTGDKKSGGGLE